MCNHCITLLVLDSNNILHNIGWLPVIIKLNSHLVEFKDRMQ